MRNTLPPLLGAVLSGGATLVHILIGAFFLATAAALHITESGAALLSGVIAAPLAITVTTVYLAVGAFALLFRTAVRPACILLALYVFATGVIRLAHSGGDVIPVLALDLTLLAALLITTLAEPRLVDVVVAPRRVAPRKDATAERPDPSRSAENPRSIFHGVWDGKKNAA